MAAAPSAAPDLPDAAEMPWHVALARVGNASAGITKVLVLAPKLEKKKVRPAASQQLRSTRPGQQIIAMDTP
jgi:hypothetical protein